MQYSYPMSSYGAHYWQPEDPEWDYCGHYWYLIFCYLQLPSAEVLWFTLPHKFRSPEHLQLEQDKEEELAGIWNFLCLSCCGP